MEDVWVAKDGRWLLPGVDLTLTSGGVTKVRSVWWGEVSEAVKLQVENRGGRERGNVEGRMEGVVWDDEGGREGGNRRLEKVRKQPPRETPGGLVNLLKPYLTHGSLEGVCVILKCRTGRETVGWLRDLGAAVLEEGGDGVDFDKWREGL